MTLRATTGLALAAAAVSAAALLGGGCRPPPPGIFPMTVGSVWNMEVVVIAGSMFQGYDTVETGAIEITAVGDTVLATGQEAVRFRNELSVYYTNDPDSTYSSTFDSYYGESDGWILSYSTPYDVTGDTVVMSDPKVGAAWSQGDSTSATVVGQEDITVKAGTFKLAWKVKTTTRVGGMTVDTYMWYARGTGLVKIYHDYTLGIYSETYNQELVSAAVK
jgi:hypothetical protein